jgi:hypothetical protein
MARTVRRPAHRRNRLHAEQPFPYTPHVVPVTDHPDVIPLRRPAGGLDHAAGDFEWTARAELTVIAGGQQ